MNQDPQFAWRGDHYTMNDAGAALLVLTMALVEKTEKARELADAWLRLASERGLPKQFQVRYRRAANWSKTNPTEIRALASALNARAPFFEVAQAAGFQFTPME